MKKILILLLLVGSLVGASLKGEVSLGYSNTKHEVKNTYHGESEFVKEFKVKGYAELNNNVFIAATAVNNKLIDYVEELVLGIEGRQGPNMGLVQVGTLPSYKGVFDTTKNEKAQPPMINKPSGVYNEAMMEGFLESVVGVEVTYKRKLGDALIGFTGIQGQPRLLNESKAEHSIIGFETDNAKLDVENTLTIVGFDVMYKNWYVFANKVNGSLGIQDTSNMSEVEKYMWYMSKDKYFDISLLFISDMFKYSINRLGGMYRTPFMMVGYEKQVIKFKNAELGHSTRAQGEYVYLTCFPHPNLSPYLAVSWAEGTSGDIHREDIVGVRYNINNNMTVLAEAGKTDWVQTRDIKAKVNMDEVGGQAKVYSLRLLYTF